MSRSAIHCLNRLTTVSTKPQLLRPNHLCPVLRRNASSSSSSSVPIKLISELRAQRPGTPLSTAKTALLNSNNDVSQALQWLEKQAATTGAAKQAKLQSREVKQGLVGVAVLSDGVTSPATGVRASVVELRCETDFVARTDEFRQLAEQIARSVAFFAEPSSKEVVGFEQVKLEEIASVPVVPPPHAATNSHVSEAQHSTVNESIQSAISRLGENITLHRVSRIAIDPVASTLPMHVVSPYLHGSVKTSPLDPSFQSGTLAGLVLCRIQPGQSEASKIDKQDVSKLARALARQVVALPTNSVTQQQQAEGGEEAEQSTALYEQGLMTLSSSPQFEFENGSKVRDVLRLWSHSRGLGSEGFEVVDLKRWQVGADE